MKTQILDKARLLARNPRWLALAGVAAVAVVATAIALFAWDRGSDVPSAPEPEGFAIYPEGEDVNRLTPVKVTFKDPPGERDPEKVMKLEPAVEGQYVWVSSRTLLFQPEFPGLLRGKEYTVSVAAQPDAGLDEAVSHRFVTSGVLNVQAVIPAPNDVEVPKAGQIMVQFSRSVAPLTLLSEQSTKPVIEFTPALPGKGEWLNTSLYRFIPDSLPGNTKYEARIAAGLTSAADGVLKEDYSWSFNTYSPALVSVSPEDLTKFASLQQKVVLAFNQPMDTAAAEAKVKITGPNNTPVAGAFSWNADRSVLTFTPSGALLFNATYTVDVPEGLPGASGGTTKTGRRTTFQTVGIPAVARTDPPNGATSAGRYGVQITFTNPMDPDSFEGKVSISGIDPEKVRADMYGDELTLYVNAQLLPSTTYTVSIAAGVKDRYGQSLTPYSFSFTTGPRQPFTVLAVPGQVGNYSASVEPVLYFHATNTSSAVFKLYRLTDAEIETILSGNGIPHLPNRLWVPSSDPIRTWTQPIVGEKDEVVIASTSLSGGGPLPKGDYFVRMDEGGWSSDLAFSVVDTAIVTKLSNDEFLAWVLDLDSGRVLPGVKVRAFGQGLGVSGTEATSDASGLASFKVPNPAGMWPPPSRSYYARIDDGGRKGVASTYWQNGTDPYQAGVQTEWYARLYVGHIYTERPIYRPGEEVFYKAVVRTDDDAKYSIPLGDLPIYLIIVDAQGKELLREKVKLNEFGTMAGSLTLPDGAAIGEYSVSLAVVRPEDPNEHYREHVAGTSFAVAEFRKPEFQVEVETDRTSYASGDTIEAKVQATYFFGGGLEGASMEWAVLGVPYYMRVKGYEQYSFSDYDYYRTSVVREGIRAQGKGVTGADGTASFSVPAVLKGTEGAMQFTVSATVTDQTAQAVASSTDVTVHPASGYAGIRPEEYLGEAGKESRIKVVTVDTEGKVIPNQKVTVNVYERTWVTTKEQTTEGARRYRSEPVDKLVATLTTTTDSKGEGSVAYTPKSSGTLRLVAELTDAQGRTARAAAYLWVWGGGFASWRVANDDTIQLIADKESYEVGDTAEILVPAPFSDAIGLVTVERGKVITRSTQTFPTNNERLTIPITDGSVPNVFVTVVLYRRPTIQDPIPRYKVGYVHLPVSTKTRELTVTIQPDRQQAKPGDKVKYDIRVTDANGKGVKAELSVAVVDKALLSLTEERGVNGMRAFWFERGLGVRTSSSLSVSINRSNDVISEPRLGGKGGSGDDERLRQDFRNTAYWQAQVVTKDDGTASVEVTMPDNLTTWRMQVRAVSGDTMVGEGTNELLSTQPLLLRPALPRFLRVGDKTTIRLLVRNATEKETDVKVSIDVEGIDLEGSTSKSGKVGPGASTLFEWPATVSTEGTAKLTFRASAGGGLSDAVVQELPVALDVTPETMATGGIVISEPMYEAVFLPKWTILKNGSLEVKVQPSLTGSMGSELSEFRRWPWEDVEGTVKIASRVIATIGVRRADKSASASVETLDSSVKNDIASLVSRQNADGGWSWCWPWRCDSDPELTGLVLIALGEARAEGYSIDGSTLSGANGWVSGYLSRLTDVANPADINQKAYLLYAMAAAGQGEFFLPQMRAMVEQYREKLANFGRAYLLLGMAAAGQSKQDSHISQLLNDLATKVIPSANGNHWEDEKYRGTTHTNTRTTAVVLDALVRTDPGHPLIEETTRWLMVARGANQWHTLTERAQAIMALSEFAVATGELAGNYGYSARVNESELFSGRFKPGDGVKTDGKTVPLSELGAGKVSIVSLIKDVASPGRMYYTMNLRYVTPAQGVEAVNRGIAVTHEYSTLDAPGTRIDRAKLGTVIRVKVTVMAPSDLKYLVVQDLLPAGFEPIDTSLKIVDPKLKAQLEAERVKLNRPAEIGYWAPWFGWYYSPWDQTQIRDDRVTLNATNLPKGVHEYVYYVRATSVGDYFVAPAYAEESFFPEVFGRSDSGRFVIEP